MSDLIRKAVELADGWDTGSVQKDWVLCPYDWTSKPIFKIHQGELDALAAQLVRQVDINDPNIGDYTVTTFVDHSVVEHWQFGVSQIVGYAESPDRTMNTIKAIVESGVLE